MDSALDPQREKFVREYHATGNASEAFRRANPKAKKWKDNSVHVRASQWLSDAKVQLRLRTLQAAACEKHEISIESLTKELDEDRKGAREAGQYSAAITAVMGKAKLHGLIVDRKDVVSDNQHHHKVDPVSIFDAFLTEAAGGRAEVDTEDSVPN